ncbi:glutamate racemase [Gilvibacter sediminis]|uniref:glutamate racemase n=1 Tax=Gilvibacter sediminis TaxID=379071 RepID=UPI002350D139|nr:glutamate racemase [Gilvibacter sediminis]MDC7998766.1 glutamate racemase [Gilvibacter sediminis]
MKLKGPIGIFDSGVGGTSIWRAIEAQMPLEHTLYLADSKNAPYGKKSKEAILALCIKNTELLIDQGAKIIVVACNTATTNAIDYLRSNYELPFIGIEPAIKPAALQTKTKSVGILATQGTLSSALFAKTSETFAKDVEVIEVIGTGLVELIESDQIESPEMESLLTQYLAPMKAANIDHLVLGCSHYPYLIPKIKTLLSKEVKIIDSGEAVARQTERILEQHALSYAHEKSSHQFYTNSDPKVISKILADHPAPKSISYKDF